MLPVGLVQMTSDGDVTRNIRVASEFVRAAHGAGAEFVLTPEVTSLLTSDKERQRAMIVPEAADPALAAFRSLAADLRIWLLIGSLPILGASGKFLNRSFLLDPAGAVRARYDKIHLFDVELGEGRSFRESDQYEGGTSAVLAETPWGPLGLSICYDVRFPQLYRAYAQAGAGLLTVPSAFTPWTGEAHWHALLRARAIECGAFVLAPAQTGDHGGGRATYGHSLVVDPWGRVLADGGAEPGVVLVELDLSAVAEARAKIPSLRHDVAFRVDSL
ncbi:carbon-nitrogen hydrolase family protein [Govanella unica]|uniref:Carbon-nitrogen hydrolase family protein n=1 Tax=Govanella unica TaxID=2975056 RepID=A0A9X3TVK3_9PROT|nr:carbon-nitrogen hydrolase family protein [Govania unica]MDA5192354.1 carbon-nitrogen hydrolase family protein [Govania unica]